MGGKYYTIDQSKKLASLAQERELALQARAEELAQAKELNIKIDTLQALFDQESKYSSFLTEISTVIPSWAKLNGLDLDRIATEESKKPNKNNLNITFDIIADENQENSIKRTAILRENLESLVRVDFVDVQNVSRNSETGEITAAYILGLNTAPHIELGVNN